MMEAQEGTPMGEENALQEEMPPGPWADEGQGDSGDNDGDAPEVVWQDDEAVPTQQEPAEAETGPNLEAPKLAGGQADGQPFQTLEVPVEVPAEVPGVQGSPGSQGEAAISPQLLTQETSAPPRQGSVTSAKPQDVPILQDVPFTSALPPSEPTSPSPQESPGGQKDEAPESPVTIDVDGVKAVPTSKGDAKRSSESKKSEGRRGSLGSYRAETLLYDRLGVDPTATDVEIRNAYKRMALQLHPDKGGDPESFKLMKEAYEVLSNHQKRTVYDLHGMEGIKCMEQAAQMEARMSDVTPVLLIMMELAQTNALMRGIVVTIVTLLGSMVVLPFILLTLKWDGATFSWAVVFIPVWIFQLVILCCQHVFLSMQQLGAPDEEDPEAARIHTKLKKEVRLLRFQSCVTHGLLISFEILLILRLEGVMTASWVVVISPWMALEVWWFLFRLYVSPVAWALSDPQAATEAGAAQAEVKRTPLFWLFLVGYLQAGVFRFLTSILISARANADGHPHAVSWWLVFLPLYFSVVLFVAIPCIERAVKRRRQRYLLTQEEDNPGSVAAKGSVATVWLMMLCLATGKFDGGTYSSAWVFSPIFFFVSLAVCVLGMVIILARPQHFQRAAESMGEAIGKPAETE